MPETFAETRSPSQSRPEVFRSGEHLSGPHGAGLEWSWVRVLSAPSGQSSLTHVKTSAKRTRRTSSPRFSTTGAHGNPYTYQEVRSTPYGGGFGATPLPAALRIGPDLAGWEWHWVPPGRAPRGPASRVGVRGRSDWGLYTRGLWTFLLLALLANVVRLIGCEPISTLKLCLLYLNLLGEHGTAV